jgi:hypothetical protein
LRRRRRQKIVINVGVGNWKMAGAKEAVGKEAIL